MSKQFSLNRADLAAAFKSALIFFAPVILIYLGSILLLLEQPSHMAKLADFLPNNATVIAIEVWILNQILGIFRRYISGK